MSRRTIRCAVYTRKSSEEGLDQDFNSLDAQYEACAAYIASQKHEGWKLSPQRYDDGGVSGGTLERPDLQRLLADVDAGLIDMIVVYKIDRLTRSLSDFSRLVERLEMANCSFVSVTQSFNTSTSMGRLTLNVLLSFAQFEREVTGERIRDKIAASKKKGMWVGGWPPLGYDVKARPERGLVVNDAEASAVTRIFQLYDEHACLGSVQQEAEQFGFRSKHRTFKNGRIIGGNVMSRGQIHFLLTNPIYVGLIRHRKETHPGQHEPIIDQVLWDRVQTKLQQASTRPRNITKSGETSLLAGKLFDENGRLTPTHAQKGKRRHRYYVSTHLVKGTARDNGTGWRLPAVPLERIVVEAVRQHLEGNMHKLVQSPDIAAIQHANARVLEFVQDVEFCASLIERIEVSRGALKVSIEANALAKLLEAKAADFDSAMLTFTVPFFVRRRGVELKLASGVTTSEPDHILIRAIAQAHEWLEEIKQGTSFSAIAQKHDWTDAMIRQRIKLAFLSPRIVQAILEGRQPSHIHLTHLLKTPLSNDWSEQENQLGFYLP